VTDDKKSRLRLSLYPRAESAIRSNHPWVYAESIKTQNREGETGELAVIYDSRYDSAFSMSESLRR